MGLGYESILSSRPFRFLVGGDRREYMLHAELVASQSKSLRVLVDGPMKESLVDCAEWEEMDEHTFIRFAQFLYTGNYDAASPVEIPESPDQSDEKAAEHVAIASSSDSWGEVWSSSMQKKKFRSISSTPSQPSKREKLWAEFKERHYCESAGGLEPPQVGGEHRDFTEVFLCHAKVFVLADYHGIPALGNLALHKLQSSLAAFEVSPARIGDISKLVAYTYENTAQLGETPCELRELVATYAACQLEGLWKSDGFQGMLETYGEFAKDLMGATLKRLD